MSTGRLKKYALISCVILAGLMGGAGCIENPLFPPAGGDDTPPPIESPDSTTTAVLVPLAPVQRTTVALGQPVLVSWEIRNIPQNPSIDIFYRATNETADKLFVGNLPTSSVGSFQLDTSSFSQGLTYIIKISLKVEGQVVQTVETPGQVVIGDPELSITAPNRHADLLPTQTLSINWTGKYLPAGATIEAFLDLDKNYNSGNEIIVQSNPLSTSGEVISGSFTVLGNTLWNNPLVKRDISYYVGLRIVKNGKVTIAAYAPATVQMYSGKGFEVLSYQNNTTLGFGDRLYVNWSSQGVPTNLKVRLSVVNRTTAQETVFPQEYSVTSGSGSMGTFSLDPGHAYDVVAKLIDGVTVIAVKKAAGIISFTTQGALIFVANDDLAEPADRVYLGMGQSMDIRWILVQPPVGARVKLFLDDLDGRRREITPAGGVAASTLSYRFTPTDQNFPLPTGQSYYVIAELHANDISFSQNRSRGQIRIGDGGINLTEPAQDIQVDMGDLVTVEWEFTGDILNKFPGDRKLLRLYADELNSYQAGRSTELTPNGGLDVSGGMTSYDIDTKLLNENSSSYIIGRLFVEGRAVEESRDVSPGRVIISHILFAVTAPSEDIEENFSAIPVTWEIENLHLVGRKVRVMAVDAQQNAFEISDQENPFDADALSGVVDASKLRPGTYRIRCDLLGYDDDFPFILAQAQAAGEIVIPDGYQGIYDLRDIAAVEESGYSPIDGTVFLGNFANIQTGFQVVGMGDINGNGFGDFGIFARFGQQSNAGIGYLIFGKEDFGAVARLDGFPDQSPDGLEGIRIYLPWEMTTEPFYGGTVQNGYTVTSVPDISDDGRADLIITCHDAAPLTFVYLNISDEEVTITDHYGQQRTLPAGMDPMATEAEPSHVFPNIPGVGLLGAMGNLGIDYQVGDMITVTYDKDPDENFFPTYTVTPLNRAISTTYLLMSQRLLNYQNSTFRMYKVGDPVDTDGMEGLDRDQMIVWDPANTGGQFGANISFIPDLRNNTRSDLIFTAPTVAVENYISETGMMRTMAGAAILRDSGARGSAVPNGGIGWAQLRLKPELTPGDPRPGFGQFDIIGPATQSNVTGASGFGVFSTLNDRAVYNRAYFSLTTRANLVLGVPGENANNGAVYVTTVETLDQYNYPLLDLKDFNDTVTAGEFIKGYKFTGAGGERLGENVVAIGDFNGNGLQDFVIAQPTKTNSAGQANAGRITIVFGKENVPLGTYPISGVTSTASNRFNALIFEGEDENDFFGSVVTRVHDVNGDGADDILVVAPGASYDGRAECGKAYLIYGRPRHPTVPNHRHNMVKVNALGETFVDYNLDGTADGIWNVSEIGDTLPGAIFAGENAGDRLQSVAFAGDVNGDGLADFLIGAPTADVMGREKAGRTYLILGREYTLPTP